MKDRLLRGAARTVLRSPLARVLARSRRNGADRDLDAPARRPDRCVVASIQYRLGPENRHPAAIRHRRHPSLIHGCLSLAGGVAAARAAVDELCGDILELLGNDRPRFPAPGVPLAPG